MKQEKPVRIVKGKSRKHRVDTHIFAREIHESFCAHRGCKFFGKHAAQGVCHTTEPFVERCQWDYVEKVAKACSEHRKDIKRHSKSRARYIEQLEQAFDTHWMSEIFRLDELIYLRRELALAQHKAKRMARRKSHA